MRAATTVGPVARIHWTAESYQGSAHSSSAAIIFDMDGLLLDSKLIYSNS